MISNGEWIVLEKGLPTPTSDVLVMQRGQWDAETRRVMAEVNAYHTNNPLRRGMPREELKSRLKYTPRFFQAALRRWLEESLLAEMGTLVRLSDFQPMFTPAQQESIQSLLARFAASPYSPPTIKECIEGVGEDVYLAILERGDLVAVSPEVAFRKEDYDRMTEEVIAHIGKNGSLTAAEFRDLYNTSRRYALAFLEHLDAIGITVRDGDVRRLRPTRK